MSTPPSVIAAQIAADRARDLAGWSDAQVRSWASQLVMAGRAEVQELLRRWDAAQSEADRLRTLLANRGIEVGP